ncbi:hypothetical protein C8J56DRAFT_1046017 [Mycena floridula]|nr:hypothetical protein C8J56DRAFT_1046017 [Mycena floridula]
MVLIGRPEGQGWDHVCTAAATALKEFRQLSEEQNVFSGDAYDHRRGKFLAVAVGISFGGGQKKPGNLVHTKKARRLLDGLLKSDAIKRIAGFQSTALQSYAPKVYQDTKMKLQQLFMADPRLQSNFQNSIYPATTFNCGPGTECLFHCDVGNGAHLPCLITSLGNFNHNLGGHMVSEDLKLVADFPCGSSIMLPSASVSHGNTSIGPNEERFSMTQYCAGGLLCWVEYGMKSAKSLEAEPGGHAKRAMLDEDRWKWALGLWSMADTVLDDYKAIFG